jgi:hypothetical protein
MYYALLLQWDVTHANDTIHVAKSVFQSTISTILDKRSKTNGVRTHRDLQKLGITSQLHPQERPNGKYYLPPASFTLTLMEKKIFYRCLREVRIPQVSHQI